MKRRYIFAPHLSIIALTHGDSQQPCALPYSADAVEALEGKIGGMKSQLVAQLQAKGFGKDRMQLEVYLNLRYDGTDTRYGCAARTRACFVTTQDY
jgi:5-oxoprolinase (ATP-hydrolysing)